ncbi:unnamed protein product [Notodromas monacha]|uniref:PX domain-containing protein n=1 Tax=Notodromas monacha TaxID=399045 RepID=A0A7R9GFJ0_9CRUS|nr:unnamed protein product [Notodromas monacha]CAG0919387.1 unnamed protein product [Notodromas monacha]
MASGGSLVQISIPGFKLAGVVSEPSRPHHLFLIDIWYRGQKTCVEKRYSSFLLLHRELRKTHQTPPFPPKKVRNFNPRVLEERRKALETYLQAVVNYYPLPEVLVDFLALPGKLKRDSLESVNTLESLSELCISHQPVFAFCRDPYVDSASSDSGSSLPDIVFKGVTHGLYYS